MREEPETRQCKNRPAFQAGRFLSHFPGISPTPFKMNLGR